jgi:hypothetical protein
LHFQIYPRRVCNPDGMFDDPSLGKQRHHAALLTCFPWELIDSTGSIAVGRARTPVLAGFSPSNRIAPKITRSKSVPDNGIGPRLYGIHICSVLKKGVRNGRQNQFYCVAQERKVSTGRYRAFAHPPGGHQCCPVEVVLDPFENHQKHTHPSVCVGGKIRLSSSPQTSGTSGMITWGDRSLPERTRDQERSVYGFFQWDWSLAMPTRREPGLSGIIM